jgi:ABC-type transporter Mla MlaB component
MEIAVSQETGVVPVTVLHLEGDLLHEEPLLSAAQEAYRQGARHLLLDLEKVPYISSAGLRTLHILYRLLEGEQNAREEQAVRQGIASGSYHSPHLKLLKPSKHALRALSVAGFDMFLDVYHERRTPLDSFGHD